jgi:hypothetical protein
LVYVQLRALDGDGWEAKIKAGKAAAPKSNDKRMTHMPTPEDVVLSFVQHQLGRLHVSVLGGIDDRLGHVLGRGIEAVSDTGLLVEGTRGRPRGSQPARRRHQTGDPLSPETRGPHAAHLSRLGLILH